MYKKWIIFLSVLIAFIAGVVGAYSNVLAVGIMVIIIVALLYSGFISGKLNAYHYIGLLIPLIIFSPPLNIMPGLPAIRLDDLWLAFGLVVFGTMVLLKKVKFSIPRNWTVLFFLAFIVWITFTIFLSSYREPYYYSTSDWFEIVKFVKLIAIFLIILNLKWNEKKIVELVNTVILSLFITSIFGIFQSFNVLNINEWLSNIYIAESNMRGFYVGGRVVGTFGNPNNFAGALIIGFALSFAKLISKVTISRIIVTSVIAFASFLTFSRTGFISIIIVVVCVFVLSFVRQKKKGSIILLPVTMLPVGMLLFHYLPDNFFMRMSNLGNLGNDTSFNARLMNWQAIYETRTKDNLLFGTGPTSNLPITFDNEWLFILTYYGVIGLALFLVMFLSISLKLNKTYHENLKWVQIATQSMIISFIFYMITLAVFHVLQLMPILMVCLAIAYKIGDQELKVET